MNIPIQHRIPREEFDFQTLLDVLKGYARPRDKISDLIRKRIIIRVKKGLYVMGDDYRRNPYSKELIANMIYGPSYISLDYALQYYGMIPERVEALTSITTGRSKRFITPLGLFTYRGVSLPAFQFGMTRVAMENDKAFLMATPEKALCDKICADRGIALRSQKDMKHYLFQNLRIEEQTIAHFDPISVGTIAHRYGSGKIRILKKLIDKLRGPEINPNVA